MPKFIKRYSNKFFCDGTCDIPNCVFKTKGFGKRVNLENHLGLNKHKCPVCFRPCSQTGNYYNHFRNAHQELLNANGGCPEYNIPDKRPSPLKPPSDLIDHKNAFQHLKEIIRNCITNDNQRMHNLKKSIQKYNKINKQDKVRHYSNILANYQGIVENSNENRHDIATQWLRYLIHHNRMDSFEHESGLTFAYQIKAHGGLFQISLDRIDNDYPHFYGSLDAFQNVRDVPLCLNTSCNPLMHYPDFKQAVLHQIKLPCDLNKHTDE